MCKVSIVIPVYNVECYLEECIQSVQNQGYDNLEIICVEDASTDNSWSILKEYEKKDARIKVFYNEENRGLSYSRNKGIKEATGDYILFLDSDDMLKDNAIKELVYYAEENELDGIVFNMQYKIEGEAAKERFGSLGDVGAERTQEQISTGKQLFCQFSKNNYWKVEACRHMWRRQFLIEQGICFYEKIFYEDNLFSFQCWMKAKRVANVNKQYYIYRRRSGAITSTIQYKHAESMFVVIMEIFSMWKSGEIDKELDESVEIFLEHLFDIFFKKKSYFSEYRELSIGTTADAYLFQKFFEMGKKQRKYAFLSKDKVEELKKCESVIVYGAGTVGVETIDLLEECEIKVDAVAVTNSNTNAKQIKGYNIYQISELEEWRKHAVVILAVVEKYHNDILKQLKQLGFENVMFLDKGK